MNIVRVPLALRPLLCWAVDVQGSVEESVTALEVAERTA
jgi:hypothetical protein